MTFFTLQEAMEFLNVSPKEFEYLVKESFLRLVNNKVNAEELYYIYDKLFAFKAIGKKETTHAYILKRTGVPLEKIAKHYNHPTNFLDDAISFYEQRRKIKLSKYDLNTIITNGKYKILQKEEEEILYNDLLFHEEVNARLRLFDDNLKYHLFNNNKIVFYRLCSNGSIERFGSLKSLLYFLYYDRETIFYNADDIAGMVIEDGKKKVCLGKKEITEIATQNNIGRKIIKKPLFVVFRKKDLSEIRAIATEMLKKGKLYSNSNGKRD